MPDAAMIALMASASDQRSTNPRMIIPKLTAMKTKINPLIAKIGLSMVFNVCQSICKPARNMSWINPISARIFNAV